MTQQSSQRIENFREMAATRERFERRMLELKEQISDCEREMTSSSASRVELKLSMSQVSCFSRCLMTSERDIV